MDRSETPRQSGSGYQTRQPDTGITTQRVAPPETPNRQSGGYQTRQPDTTTQRVAPPETPNRQSGGYQTRQPDTTTQRTPDPTNRQSGGYQTTPLMRTDQGKPPGYVTGSGNNQRSTTAGVAPQQSEADRAISRGQSKQAYQQFIAEQNKFKAPPVAAPVSQQAAQASSAWRQYGGTNRWGTADQYYAQRQQALTRVPTTVNNYYSNPPAWVSNGPPSYGGWSSNFLGGVLLGAAGTMAYDMWAYSHRSDPGYIAWHRDMERQAQDNAELREKLTTLDTRVADLQAKNTPVSDKLPNDIDPALVVAPDTVMLATAKSGTNWWIWGPIMLGLGGIAFLGVCVAIARHRHPRYG